MPHSHFHNLLEEAVKQEIVRRGDPLIRGGCSDQAHYQYQCGTIVGLELALKIANELEKKDE